MPRPRGGPVFLSRVEACRLWLRAQRLDVPAPFGEGPDATPAAVRQLGYVQIDTIAVVERCHHHILWNRIPDYRPAHLHAAQSDSKTVFEYWTHALAYVPSADYAFMRPAMRRQRENPRRWFGTITPGEVRRVLDRIRDGGPLTLRDIDDDVLEDKDHPWASRKPSKRALQFAFLTGDLTISARSGMLKTYELTDRHFGWDKPPRAATDTQVLAYQLDRALTAQGLVSLDSVCHLEPSRKPAMRAVIEARVARRQLRPVSIEGAAKVEHWAAPATLEAAPSRESGLAGHPVHILSPFDPLVIQRKRLALFFGYEHRFEAYLPKEKRTIGYFALPVLVDGTVVAALDLKTDRAARTLRVQRWTWFTQDTPAVKLRIEEALHRFERFQLGD